jgi:EpsI family protein
MTGSLSLLIVVAAFVFAKAVKPASVPRPTDLSQAPPEVQGWQTVSMPSGWSPAFSSAHTQIRQSYMRNGVHVGLFLAKFARQAKGQEMIASDNRILDQTQWTIIQERGRVIDLGAKTLPVGELVAASGEERRYVWLLYWVGGSFTANPIVAKVLEVKAKLFFGDQRAAIIAVATSDAAGRDDADRVLHSFLEKAFPSIEMIVAR